jgi:hypothetical protein
VAYCRPSADLGVGDDLKSVHAVTSRGRRQRAISAVRRGCGSFGVYRLDGAEQVDLR